jgi:outer membrane protein
LNLPVEAQVDYMGDLDMIPFERGLEDCLDAAFRQRPNLLMAQKSVDIARKDLGMARSTFYPQVNASLAWGSTGNDWRAAGGRFNSKGYSQWQFGVTAQWALFTSGKRLFVMGQANSQIAAMEAQKQAAESMAAFEIKASLLGAQDAKRMIPVAERAVDSAQESYSNAKMRYELQLGTNLDLLTAQSNLAGAELTLISAKAEYLTALSKLYVAMGDMRPDLKP